MSFERGMGFLLIVLRENGVLNRGNGIGEGREIGKFVF